MREYKDITYIEVRNSLNLAISDYAILTLLFSMTGWRDLLTKERIAMSAALIYLSFLFMKRGIKVFRKIKNADFTSEESKKITLLFDAYSILIVIGVILIISSNFI